MLIKRDEQLLEFYYDLEKSKESHEEMATKNQQLFEQVKVSGEENKNLIQTIVNFETKINEALKLKSENTQLKKSLSVAEERNKDLLEANKIEHSLYLGNHNKNTRLLEELSQVKQENRSLKSTIQRLETKLATLATTFAQKITKLFTSEKIPVECKAIDADLQFTVVDLGKNNALISADDKSVALSKFFQGVQPTVVKITSGSSVNQEVDGQKKHNLSASYPTP